MKPWIKNLTKKRILSHLQNLDPARVRKKSEGLALKQFHRAALTVPFYSRLLREARIDPKMIGCIEDFQGDLPVIDKDGTFIKNQGTIQDLCVKGGLEGFDSILSSSGFSGHFSYGLNRKKELIREGRLIDMLLDINFDINNGRVLLIN